MARAPSRWKLRKARRRFEQLYALYVLEKLGGDREKAIRVLGISLASFKEKISTAWMKR